VLGVVLGGGKGEFDIVRDNFFWCVGKIALFKEKKKEFFLVCGKNRVV